MPEAEERLDHNKIPTELIKLGTYDWPRSEARQTLGHLYEKIKSGFASNMSENAIDTESLTSVTDAPFKESVDELLAKALHDMVDHQYGEWANTTDSKTQRRALVHPPMQKNILCDWAEQRGFPVLRPESKLSDFSNATCIVVPDLEAFFSRDHTKLLPLFDLFADFTHFSGNILIGCNSWAWRYLRQFDDALLLFGTADVFPAFDANALATILSEAHSRDATHASYTSVASGDPILARDDDGELKDPYLENLASQSLGHPWVAIEMFFRSIAETKDTEDASRKGRTWVDIPGSCSLPTSGADPLLFALHALMIHGPRPIDALNKLLPHRVPNGTWTELDRIGFVTVKDGRAECIIRNYPDIRSELSAAGFNLDEL